MSLTQNCEKSGGRGKHRLYKEETFISEPIDSTGEFLVSCLFQLSLLFQSHHCFETQHFHNYDPSK